LSNEKPPKSWTKLEETGKGLTDHKLEEEMRQNPWRRPFRAGAPDIAKASLKRDFEVGLVYYVGDDVEQDRALCGLDRKPPTAHLFKDALEKKKVLLDEVGVVKRLGFDKKKGKFEY
jgi:heterodisulfide reductase subunit C